MTHIDTTDPIARMNAAKDARRHRGLGPVRHVPQHAPVELGHHKERRDLMRAVALVAEYRGASDLVDTVHFCRLDNDELREFLESQFDLIAAWADYAEDRT